MFDDNNEKKFNRVLNRYCNYSDLFTCMLSIDEELETASNLKDQVVYFYDHCNYDNAKKRLEEIIIDFRSFPVEEMSPFANTLTNWKNEIINLLYFGAKTMWYLQFHVVCDKVCMELLSFI